MSGRLRGRRSLFVTLLRGSLFERRGRVWLAIAPIAIGTSVAAALMLVSRDVGSKVQHELRAYGPNAMLAPGGGVQAVGARGIPLAGLAPQAPWRGRDARGSPRRYARRS